MPLIIPVLWLIMTVYQLATKTFQGISPQKTNFYGIETDPGVGQIFIHGLQTTLYNYLYFQKWRVWLIFRNIILYSPIFYLFARHRVAALDSHIIILLAEYIMRSHKAPFASLYNNGQNRLEIYNSVIKIFLDRIGEVIVLKGQSEDSKYALLMLHQLIYSWVSTDRDRESDIEF